MIGAEVPLSPSIVIELVEQSVGIEAGLISTRLRSEQLSFARAIIAYTLHRYGGYSLPHISQLIRGTFSSHSSIHDSISRIETGGLDQRARSVCGSTTAVEFAMFIYHWAFEKSQVVLDPLWRGEMKC